MKPGKNLVVVLEEELNKDPKGIEFMLVNRDVICSKITARHPPSAMLFERNSGDIMSMGEPEGMKPAATLRCPAPKKVTAVEFASLGDPLGFCGGFAPGNCNSPVSKQVVEKVLLFPLMKQSIKRLLRYDDHVTHVIIVLTLEFDIRIALDSPTALFLTTWDCSK